MCAYTHTHDNYIEQQHTHTRTTIIVRKTHTLHSDMHMMWSEPELPQLVAFGKAVWFTTDIHSMSMETLTSETNIGCFNSYTRRMYHN